MTDPIANFLKQKRIALQPAYFLGSKLLLGYEFVLKQYKIIFRTEKNSLIVCELTRLENAAPSATGLLGLFAFLRIMSREVNEVTEIKGMIIKEVFNQQLHETRVRLMNILLKKGAVLSTDDNGDDWLVFTLYKNRALSKPTT